MLWEGGMPGAGRGQECTWTEFDAQAVFSPSLWGLWNIFKCGFEFRAGAKETHGFHMLGGPWWVQRRRWV